MLLYERWMEGTLGDLHLERLGYCPVEIEALHRHRARILGRLTHLYRRDLVCWCPATSRWCHANALLILANSDLPRRVFFQ